ncbi:ComEA family DNA-binding protein [Herbiconiux sp. VKM Ac-1786]|uniref:ComEA family DNA-binding protein n=1 Tax=Herbiconiux sp. VKM Ac-1786 TaxID=2783824 RepID=UPI00188BA0C0|nr:ComEA family DNA-binding protein [Herbiconiux sp. VKM Ac-1786]MBF4570957.1 ComEA family DNA-binding protein [Herbiconiux sp. VKM Ac-1786]
MSLPAAPPPSSSSPSSPSFRVRVGVGAAVVLVVAALVASVLVTALTPVGATTVIPDARAGGSPAASAAPSSAAPASPGVPPTSSLTDPAAPAAPPLLVHVLGAVGAPGVYQLAAGSRVVDAVAAAGGFAPTADSASVNLARPLVDGEQLRVLAVGETPPAPLPGAPVAAAPGAADSSAGSGAGSGAAAPGGAPTLVDLNTATEIDLDTLPRIGPAMATRIVAYRDANGPFASIDDLLQIPGIGDKTLESLRPLLTL